MILFGSMLVVALLFQAGVCGRSVVHSVNALRSPLLRPSALLPGETPPKISKQMPQSNCVMAALAGGYAFYIVFSPKGQAINPDNLSLIKQGIDVMGQQIQQGNELVGQQMDSLSNNILARALHLTT